MTYATSTRAAALVALLSTSLLGAACALGSGELEGGGSSVAGPNTSGANVDGFNVGAGNVDGSMGGGGQHAEGNNGAAPGGPGAEGCPVLAQRHDTGPGVTTETPTFTQHTLLRTTGAAFMHPADLDADGFPEFLLTTLTGGPDATQLLGTIIGSITGDVSAPLLPGSAYVVRRQGGAPADGELGTWEAVEAFGASAGIDWPNESELFDVDNDGVEDWIIGAGFIPRPTGRIVWMKGTRTDGTLGFAAPREIPVPNPEYWYHVARPVDMDGDGDMDFVTTSHKGAVGVTTSTIEWFENDGVVGTGVGFTAHLLADERGGSILDLHDIDGDGDQDVVVPQFFSGQSLLWFENVAGDGSEWSEHLIDDTTGRGFSVHFADVDGDGRDDIVYTNHNHQDAVAADDQVMGVYWWSIPTGAVAARQNWNAEKHVVHEGFQALGGPEDANSIGAPGSFNVGDIDGDGDLDFAVAGDGDPGLYLFLQETANSYTQITLDTGHDNSGVPVMVDLDGDCDQDVIWAVFGASTMSEPESHVFAFLQD